MPSLGSKISKDISESTNLIHSPKFMYTSGKATVSTTVVQRIVKFEIYEFFSVIYLFIFIYLFMYLFICFFFFWGGAFSMVVNGEL